VRDADDGIVLTDLEREALAGLAESIGDPWLAGQLVGQEKPPAPRRRRRPVWSGRAFPRVGKGWIGVPLTLAGALLALVTFAASAVVASLGLALMGVGLWRLVVDQGEGISRRLSNARRTRAPQPTPPHTPPGAA
jgi:hypothetical protein